MRKYALVIFSLLSVSFLSAQAPSHTSAKLISSVKSIIPGHKFFIGVEFKMEPGWHIYWSNPGEAGMATSIKFSIPRGFKISELKWPFPHNFVAGGIANFGYEEEVLLFAEVTAPEKLNAEKFKFTAKADWLECKEACLPGGENVDLILPLGELKAAEKSSNADKFEKYLKQIPGKNDAVTTTAERTENIVELEIKFPRQSKKITDAEFFPYEGGIFSASSNQKFKFDGHSIRLELKLEPLRVKDPVELSGVLVYEEEGTKSTIIKTKIK